METIYISFCGSFIFPGTVGEIRPDLEFEKLLCEDEEGHWYEDNVYLDGVEYRKIDSENQLRVYLADLGNGIGHLVADCGDSFQEETLVYLKNGFPVKSPDNGNPNPVRQLV